MAMRYSGDVELRVSRDRQSGDLLVALRCPRGNARWRLDPRGYRDGSEGYDEAASDVLRDAEEKYGELPVERGGRGQYVVRRTFQSPCPVQRGRGSKYR